MKNIRIILMIVFVCNILIANAQENNQGAVSKRLMTVKIGKPEDLYKTLQNIKGVLKGSVVVDPATQIVTIEYYDNEEEKVLNKIEKMTVNAKLVEYIPVETSAVVEQTLSAVEEQFKFKPEIDKFLNIEDASIFSDENFMNLTDDEQVSKQIHPRSKGYYLLIRNIYTLKNLLNSSLEQKQQAKEKLSKASDIIDEINDNVDKCYKASLSEQQQGFYDNLVNEFNRLYSSIYE